MGYFANRSRGYETVATVIVVPVVVLYRAITGRRLLDGGPRHGPDSQSTGDADAPAR